MDNIETEIYKKLKLFFDTYKVGEIIKIESGITCLGIPDSYYACYNGIHGWIEIKQLKNYKGGIISIPYRPGQQAWLNLFNKIIKTVYVFILIKDEYYLINKNFKQKRFVNLEALCHNVIWHNKKLNTDLKSVLRRNNVKD